MSTKTSRWQTSMQPIHHLYSLFLNSTQLKMGAPWKTHNKKVETSFHLCNLYQQLHSHAVPGLLPPFWVFGSISTFLNFGTHCTHFLYFGLGGFCPILAPHLAYDFILCYSSGWISTRPPYTNEAKLRVMPGPGKGHVYLSSQRQLASGGLACVLPNFTSVGSRGKCGWSVRRIVCMEVLR